MTTSRSDSGWKDRGLADTESRMGIPSLDELLAERARLVAEVAPLRARHGPGGTYNDLRKIELAKAGAIVRATAAEKGQKITEAFVEEQAHQAGFYIDFVTQATTEKAEWAALEDQIQAINDRILRARDVARYLASEVSLTPR